VHGCTLDVELGSLEEVMAEQVEKLNVLARGCGGPCEIHDAPGGQFGVSEQVFNYDVVVKVTMLPGSIAELVRDVIALRGTAVAQATGIMLAGFHEKAAANAVPSLKEYVDLANGTLTVLKANMHPAPSWAVQQRKRGDKVPELMRAVKKQFDAKQTLNPGRLVGGV
jgi:FAD/FMN-containing dehydrogenase